MNELKEKLIEYRLKNPGKLQSIRDKVLYKELIESEEFKELSWKEKAYSIIHGPIPKCLCGNVLKLRPPTDEFLYGRPAQYCSNQCRSNDTKFKEKVNTSYIDKYGSHPFASEEVKNKIKKTNLERYGVENSSSSQTIKNKIKSTFVERYGDHPWKTKEGRDKINQIIFDKYGVQNPWQIEHVKNRIRKGSHNRRIKNEVNTEFSHLLSINDLNKIKEFLEKTIIENNFDRRDQLSKFLNYQYLQTCRLISKLSLEHHFPAQYISTTEQEVADFVKSLDLEIEQSNRSILEGSEIDILIHSHKLAIEFDGIYWHSHNMKGDKNYHLDKTNIIESKGYQLLHIFENEWICKQEIWKSIIKAKLGLFDRRIYARKCQIKEILPKESRKFLDINHLAGFANASVHLGLFYNDELVSVMSYGKSRFNTNDTEVIRFATLLNTQVIGGFSKLLNILKGPIVCFADRRISSINNSSNESFFDSYEMTSPAFWIIEGNELKHRLGYTKQKLMLYHTFDNDISTFENLLNHHNIIYDCGNIKYSMNRDT